MADKCNGCVKTKLCSQTTKDRRNSFGKCKLYKPEEIEPATSEVERCEHSFDGFGVCEFCGAGSEVIKEDILKAQRDSEVEKEELVEKVLAWANDKGIDEVSAYEIQFYIAGYEQRNKEIIDIINKTWFDSGDSMTQQALKDKILQAINDRGKK